MSIYGWIVYNGFLPGDKFRDFAEMLQDAAINRGHKIELKTNDDIVNHLDTLVFSKTYKPLPNYVLFTDKDIYLANTLERANINVFNRAEAIDISDDKIKTYEKLVKKNIPIPKTMVAPKTFGIEIDVHTPFLQHVIHELRFPFIIKEAFGSFGEQVYLVHNEADLAYYLQKIGSVPFLFQQYIATSYGVDLRLQVVGNEVVAAMKRTSESDFRANVTSGGTMQPYEPNELERTLAIEATKAIGAHFAGVDLLLGEHGERYVCEVNTNAHIRNLYDCTNINVAPYIVKLVERELNKGGFSC